MGMGCHVIPVGDIKGVNRSRIWIRTGNTKKIEKQRNNEIENNTQKFKTEQQESH